MPLSPVLPNNNNKIESLLKFINQVSPDTEIKQSEILLSDGYTQWPLSDHNLKQNLPIVLAYDMHRPNNAEFSNYLYFSKKTNQLSHHYLQEDELFDLLRNKTCLFEIASSSLNLYNVVVYALNRFTKPDLMQQINEEMPTIYQSFVKPYDFIFNEMVLAILDRVYRYLHDDPDVKLISVN